MRYTHTVYMYIILSKAESSLSQFQSNACIQNRCTYISTAKNILLNRLPVCLSVTSTTATFLPVHDAPLVQFQSNACIQNRCTCVSTAKNILLNRLPPHLSVTSTTATFPPVHDAPLVTPITAITAVLHAMVCGPVHVVASARRWMSFSQRYLGHFSVSFTPIDRPHLYSAESRSSRNDKAHERVPR